MSGKMNVIAVVDLRNTPDEAGRCSDAQRRKLPDERKSITHKFSIGGHEGIRANATIQRDWNSETTHEFDGRRWATLTRLVLSATSSDILKKAAVRMALTD